MDRGTVITIAVIVGIVALAAFFTFNVINKNDSKEQSDAARIITPGPDVWYTDLEGNRVELSHYEGKVLVVNSWASWCSFCVQELPEFSRLASFYSEREVIVLAINRKEPLKTVQNFLRTLNETDSVLFLQDPNDFFYTNIGGLTMPETVFYDKNGNVVFHKRGFMKFEEMRVHVDAAIAATN